MRWIKSQLNRKKMFYHKHDSINLKALHLKVVIFPKSVVVAVLPSKVLIKGRPHLKLQFRNKSKKRRQKLLVARFSLSSTNWMNKNFKESATWLFNHLQKKFKTKSQLKSQHQLKMKKLRIWSLSSRVNLRSHTKLSFQVCRDNCRRRKRPEKNLSPNFQHWDKCRKRLQINWKHKKKSVTIENALFMRIKDWMNLLKRQQSAFLQAQWLNEKYSRGLSVDTALTIKHLSLIDCAVMSANTYEGSLLYEISRPNHSETS